ncbi:MAG: hypothetical protein ACREHD_33255 [Pirellulales bacterium]
MLALKKLNSADALGSFAMRVEEAMHVRLPIEYLQRGDVVAWMADDQSIVAGFALILDPPFRVLTVIPESNYDDWFRDQLAEGRVAEINGVFVTDKAKGAVSGASLLCEAAKHIVASGRTCILFGYNKEKVRLRQLWNRPFLDPVCLLDGTVAPPTGYTTSTNVYMGYFRSDQIKRAFKL